MRRQGSTPIRTSFNATILALLLIFVPLVDAQPAELPRKTAVVSFGLFGDQDVFRSEATGAAQVIASRFKADPVVVRFNNKTSSEATIPSLETALQTSAAKLVRDRDILFLVLTSHGTHNGLVVIGGKTRQILPPWALGAILDRTSVRRKVVIISACYSGIFIPRLADADTLVITAADAEHPSFGCQDKAKWTYFGEAFFNVALRQADNLHDAFVRGSTLVRERELREGFEPSNPQIAGGDNVEPLLVARRR